MHRNTQDYIACIEFSNVFIGLLQLGHLRKWAISPLFFDDKLYMNEKMLENINAKIEPIISNDGFEIIELEYKNEPGGQVLRIYIDSPNGITLEDCISVTRSIEDVIEIEELVPNSYRLEVSSPGWNRPLRKAADFDRFKGSEIKLESKSPIEGRKRWRGQLLGLENDDILVMVDGKLCHVPWNNLAKARVMPNTNEWKK